MCLWPDDDYLFIKTIESIDHAVPELSHLFRLIIDNNLIKSTNKVLEFYD